MYRTELHKAIILAGSQIELAKKLKVTRAVINNWLNREIQVPVDKALLAEGVFKGKVLAEKLVPHKATEILTFKAYWRNKVKTDA